MTTSTSSTAIARLTRGTGAVAVLWGAALLLRGPDIWRAVDGRSPGEGDELAVRFLGVRHLVQGGSQMLAPGRFRRLFVAVDVVHALSMVALAAVDEPRRRPALVTGGGAAATALLSVVAGRQRA